MTQFLAFIFGIILISIPAMAQLYDGKAQEVTEPLDTAIAQANALYSNVAVAGTNDDMKSQEARYQEMIGAMNGANEHHFEMLRNETK